MSPAGRGAPKENVGVFEMVLVFVCCEIIGVVFVFEPPILNDVTDVAGAKRNKRVKEMQCHCRK